MNTYTVIMIICREVYLLFLLSGLVRAKTYYLETKTSDGDTKTHLVKSEGRKGDNLTEKGRYNLGKLSKLKSGEV